jgi:hypothetical protein
MSTVATHSRFGADLDHLRGLGIAISVHQSEEDLSSIQLDEPRYGETLLGNLTDEEKAMYVDLYQSSMDLEGLHREYVGAAIARIGNTIRASDRHKPLMMEEQNIDFGGPENRLAYCRLEQRVNVLKSNLYWSIGERYGCHDWSIGVRSKFRAFKVAEKVQ